MAFYNIPVLRVPVAQGTIGATQLLPPSAGNRHKVVGILLVLSADGTFQFTDDSGPLTGPMDLPGKGGFLIPCSQNWPFVQTGVNSSLNVVTTGGKANGVVLYFTEP